MQKKIDYYLLSIKYWLQGDEWAEAQAFAERLVYGFKEDEDEL